MPTALKFLLPFPIFVIQEIHIRDNITEIRGTEIPELRTPEICLEVPAIGGRHDWRIQNSVIRFGMLD
jgi:hypothetical protein